MTDERGGRYFREARFFLAGDRVAAQSHILEARSLMGYMRDMQALGGPPIQVKYAALPDGTQIKATMMNGQYQAEIVSPFGTLPKGEVSVPTLAGCQRELVAALWMPTKPFKWQKSTGIVYLNTLPTHDYYYVQKVSDDGSMCAGYARVNGGPIVDGLTAYSWVVWSAEGEPTVLGDMRWADAIDVRYGAPALFPMPPSFEQSGDYQTQRIGGNEMLFLGGVLDPVDSSYYATATKVTLDPPSEQVLVVGPMSTDGFSSSARDASVMFFTEARLIVHPLGGTYTLRTVRKAVRDDSTGDYSLSSALHPALENVAGRPFCDSVGDAIVVGELEVYPYSWLANSTVPAVYTQSTGELVRLEQHTGDLGVVYSRSIVPRAMCSDGSLVAGVWFDQTDDYAIAWQKVDDVWSRIPGLGADFRGECTATN